MNLLVLTGAWCGDCIRQCPIIQTLADLSPCLAVRYRDNQSAHALRDELRVLGGKRVPVVVFLSEDWYEIGRFGDRTLSAYRRKAARELGAACDAGIMLPADEELAQETQEWFEMLERYQLMVRLAPALRARYGD